MEATYEIKDVDSVETTLHLTMTINEWRKLAAILQGSNVPGWTLANRISDMITRAHKQYAARDLRIEDEQQD